MKKNLILGALFITTGVFAHDHFLYTDDLDATGKDSIKIKAMLCHPDEGKEEGAVNIGTINGKTTLPKKFFVVHNGKTTDLTDKVKIGKITTDKNTATTFDIIYGKEDGLKGGGSWVFFMEPGETQDEGYSFFPSVKLIVTKDFEGADYYQRVAKGSNEIVPLLNPVNAWKENVFRAKFIDKNGKPIKNARVDVHFINADIDIQNDLYRGGDEMEKVGVRVFTDENGVFAFTPSRAGKWVIRAVASLDKEKKDVHDTSLIVQFE